MQAKLFMQRYHRQIVLPEIGMHGQQRLQQAKVCCVGVGALGSPVLMYLAAAGVGTLGIIDYDQVESANLHRQIIFNEQSINHSKVDWAKNTLANMNSCINIKTYDTKLSIHNAEELIQEYAVIIDCTDNFTAKFLINDCAIRLKIPMIYGAILGFEGQVATFFSPLGACYRCLYPEPPNTLMPNCMQHGVVGPLPGIIGSIQALECIKYLLLDQENITQEHLLINRLFTMNGKTMHTKEYAIQRASSCISCSHKTVTTKKSTPDINITSIATISASYLQNQLDHFYIIDLRSYNQWAAGNIPGSKNIPSSTIILKNNLSTITNKKILIYCQHGISSEQVLCILQQQGIKKLYHLAGGYAAWINSIIC